MDGAAGCRFSPAHLPPDPQTETPDIAAGLDCRAWGDACVHVKFASLRREVTQDPPELDSGIERFSLDTVPGGVPRQASALWISTTTHGHPFPICKERRHAPVLEVPTSASTVHSARGSTDCPERLLRWTFWPPAFPGGILLVGDLDQYLAGQVFAELDPQGPTR